MTDETDRQFVEVYRARNAPQAHLIRNTLEDAGIAVRLENEILQGLAGELPMGWASAPRVLVEADRAAEARTLIERFDVPAPAEEEGTSTRCLACGAPMSEDEETCSACGWSYEDQEQEAE
jgi:hypothetical protein